MPRYFFDYRDGLELIRESDGLELKDLNADRDEATRGLANFSRDVLLGSHRRELAIEKGDLAIEVRDSSDNRVLRAVLRLETLP